MTLHKRLGTFGLLWCIDLFRDRRFLALRPFHRNAQLLTQDHGGVVIDVMGDGRHDAILHQDLDQVDGATVHQFRQVTNGDRFFHNDRFNRRVFDDSGLFRPRGSLAVHGFLPRLAILSQRSARLIREARAARLTFVFCCHKSKPPHSHARKPCSRWLDAQLTAGAGQSTETQNQCKRRRHKAIRLHGVRNNWIGLRWRVRGAVRRHAGTIGRGGPAIGSYCHPFAKAASRQSLAAPYQPRYPIVSSNGP